MSKPSKIFRKQNYVSSCDITVPVQDAQLRVRRYMLPDMDLKRQSVSPTLVFLHEGLGCVEMWKEFPQRVCSAAKLPGIAYDRQGYGQSSPFVRERKPDYLHIEAFEYLPALLTSLGITESILIGHSDGGTIALLFAGAYQRQVRSLVTIAAHVFVEPETVQGIAEARWKYQHSDWPQKLAKYHQDKTDAVFYAWTDTWLSPEFAEWNIEKELPNIVSPVLVIQGTGDAFGTAKQVESIVYNTTGPAQPCWIDDCGHVPYLEKQEEVLEAICRFIAQRSG